MTTLFGAVRVGDGILLFLSIAVFFVSLFVSSVFSSYRSAFIASDLYHLVILITAAHDRSALCDVSMNRRASRSGSPRHLSRGRDFLMSGQEKAVARLRPEFLRDIVGNALGAVNGLNIEVAALHQTFPYAVSDQAKA